MATIHIDVCILSLAININKHLLSTLSKMTIAIVVFKRKERRILNYILCITRPIRHGFIIQEENECNFQLVLYSSEVAH